MGAALGWGAVGGVALIVGALIGLYAPAPQRLIGLVTAFGGGVLVSSVTLDLVAGAIKVGGVPATAAGLGAGALVFAGGDWAVNTAGGKHRKRSTGQQREGRAMGIVLGALLDGIPESAAIGISLLTGEVSAVFVAAVFISNVPEALSASVGLRRAGREPRRILLMWVGITAASALAAGAGYLLLDGAAPGTIAGINSFAGGAILAMLASTMFPEATEEGGGPAVGLFTAAGFLASVVLLEL